MNIQDLYQPVANASDNGGIRRYLCRLK